ncbi:MAG TPA: hypothetical protein DHW81_07110, partial [Nitrospiraceae bacterium]|nr:hypothetical protein [Nitrospiraceae bacterium]
MSANGPRIIAVSSGKGGVGKTTVAVNLALALAAKGNRVGLMDGDIYGPNVPLMLGVAPETRPLVNEQEKLLPIEVQGLKMISMGVLVPADQPMIWRGPMLHSAVTQFVQKVDWGELDFLVIDLPPGTGDIQLTLTQKIPLAGAVQRGGARRIQLFTRPGQPDLEPHLQAFRPAAQGGRQREKPHHQQHPVGCGFIAAGHRRPARLDPHDRHQLEGRTDRDPLLPVPHPSLQGEDRG